MRLIAEYGRFARRIREPLRCVMLEGRNACCAKPPGWLMSICRIIEADEQVQLGAINGANIEFDSSPDAADLAFVAAINTSAADYDIRQRGWRCAHGVRHCNEGRGDRCE